MLECSIGADTGADSSAGSCAAMLYLHTPKLPAKCFLVDEFPVPFDDRICKLIRKMFAEPHRFFVYLSECGIEHDKIGIFIERSRLGRKGGHPPWMSVQD